MNGYLPAMTDKQFTINGTKFHYGVQGLEFEESMRLTLVREALPGKGVYAGAGAVSTWVTVHDMDLSVFLSSLPDMPRTEQLDSAFYAFTTECNAEIAKFTGGSGGTPPTFPTDLFQQCKWYLENRVSFDSAKNQMVFK